MNIISVSLYFCTFESSINKPTPTPAPNRGGPAACLGGPVAYLRCAPFSCPKSQLKGWESSENHWKIMENHGKSWP